MGNVVQVFAESPATLRFDDGHECTAGALVEEGCRVAGWLRGEGFEHADRIAIRMPNGADFVRLLMACAAGGFTAVSVNRRYSDAEVGELIRRTGARPVDLDGHSDRWRNHDPIDPVGGPDHPFVVFTTSGTTSTPKLVLHRQHSIADHAGDAATSFGYDTDDTVLVAMPLGGTFGLASLTSAVAGGSRVLVTDYDTVRTAQLIVGERVTCLNGSDDMFHRLLEHDADLASIRLGGYARFNTSLDGIVERAAEAGATLTGLYGMSEVQALFSLRDPHGTSTERACAGGTLVAADAAYRVIDGELQLRGPSLFAGYLAEGGDRIDTELTDRHFDGEWFLTGDLAEPGGARTFEYLARMGDALRLGGFLVSPAEIEQVVMQVAGVEAVQVVSVDLPGGARPVAFVVAPNGVHEERTIEYCSRHLARYKVPVRVIVIDEFPTTPSANGTKIQKVKLRSLARSALTDPTPNG
jgi:fatty-acyl-CoA synthase